MDIAETSSIDRQARTLSTILLVLRIVVGIIMVAHGSQKLFGLFGGMGIAATVKWMGPVGYLVAIGEFFGGLGIIFGFLTRFSAAALIVIQIGAIVKVHWANGFFLGQKPGFEYNLSLIGILISLLIAGPGRYAIIRLLSFLAPKGLKKVIAFLE
jgi:putative oxidoreductase